MIVKRTDSYSLYVEDDQKNFIKTSQIISPNDVVTVTISFHDAKSGSNNELKAYLSANQMKILSGLLNRLSENLL